MGEVSVAVIGKEHGICIFRTVERSRECDKDIHIAVMVKIIAVHILVNSSITVKCLLVEFTGSCIDQQFQIRSRENVILYAVTVKVGSDYLTAYFIDYPSAVTCIEIDYSVFLINQIHKPVSVKVNGLGWSRNVGTHSLCP